MDYRERLKCLRVDKDLTQEQIAEVCCVSGRAVSYWENQKRDISIDCLIKLCRFYNVSADYILGLKENIE